MVKKLGKLVFNVIYWCVFLAIFFILFGGKFFGYDSFVVQTGSMRPEIPVGSVVVADSRYDYGSVEEGDVIIFSKDDTRVTHRVVSITEEGIETKGDANNVSDGITTTRENFCGKVLFHIPVLGIVVNGYGKILLVGGMVILYIAYLLIFDDGEAEDKEEENTVE